MWPKLTLNSWFSHLGPWRTGLQGCTTCPVEHWLFTFTQCLHVFSPFFSHHPSEKENWLSSKRQEKKRINKSKQRQEARRFHSLPSVFFPISLRKGCLGPFFVKNGDPRGWRDSLVSQGFPVYAWRCEFNAHHSWGRLGMTFQSHHPSAEERETGRSLLAIA